MLVARRLVVMLSLALALGGGWTACVGDDPGATKSAPAMGDRLGPCFPDGKCKEGLVCRDGEICLTPDEPKPNVDAGGGEGDANTTDVVVPDAASEASTCTPHPSTAGPFCLPSSCASGEACCQSGTAPVCGAPGGSTCPAAANIWACETRAQCGNLRCCLLAEPSTGTPTDNTTSCANKVQNGRTRCLPEADCAPTGGRQTCATDFECSSSECRNEEVATALGFSIVIKVCK
ncbi:MAG TPA: hypothetical protein VM925_13975 [Labilithrix sp.]|nr:hypothetical protein [Labilithrix sp.]